MSSTPPTKVRTLDELGLLSPLTCGSVAVAAPFPFLSAQGVRDLPPHVQAHVPQIQDAWHLQD